MLSRDANRPNGRAVRPGRRRPGAVGVTVLLAGVLLAAMLPGSAAAALSVSKWEAGTCNQVNCEDSGPPSRFYTQAAGHPDFGITDFRFATQKVGIGHEQPTGKVKDVRVDLPVGLAVNPEATEQCSEAQLDAFKCPAGSQVGEDEAVGTASVLELLHLGLTVTEHFPVYNMQRKPGEPARFGVEVNSPTLETLATLGHDLRGQIYLEGGISWHHEAETSESSGVPTGDYHEFFEIRNIAQEPEVIESKLIFWGIPQDHTHVGAPTAFITLPSTCTSKPVTYLHVDSYEAPGAFIPYGNETPVTATGCNELAFNPSLSLGGGRQRPRPPGRADRGPARPAVDSRTVQARLTRRAERPGDAARRLDAEPLRRPRTRRVQRRAVRGRQLPRSLQCRLGARERPRGPRRIAGRRRVRGCCRRRARDRNRAASTGCS